MHEWGYESKFQYPRLDRRVENDNPREKRYAAKLCFSIHDWIEGSKTYTSDEARRFDDEFQYPRLDRRVENGAGSGRRFSSRRVSVSTTGSKGRKHPFARQIYAIKRCLSIHDWIEGSKTELGI